MYKTMCMADQNFLFKNRHLKAQKTITKPLKENLFSYPVWLLDHMLSPVLHGYNIFTKEVVLILGDIPFWPKCRRSGRLVQDTGTAHLIDHSVAGMNDIFLIIFF